MRRLLPPHLVLLLVVAMSAATAVSPMARIVSGPWRSIGLVLAVLGTGLTGSGARHFDRVGTNIRTFDDPGTIVVDGPFARTRNPMYLGFLVGLIGVAVMLGSVVAWCGPLVFFVLADRWYVPFEEERMTTRFGEAYDRYRAGVPRWFRVLPR